MRDIQSASFTSFDVVGLSWNLRRSHPPKRQTTSTEPASARHSSSREAQFRGSSVKKPSRREVSATDQKTTVFPEVARAIAELTPSFR